MVIPVTPQMALWTILASESLDSIFFAHSRAFPRGATTIYKKALADESAGAFLC